LDADRVRGWIVDPYQAWGKPGKAAENGERRARNGSVIAERSRLK
jgi:hypothetical protein